MNYFYFVSCKSVLVTDGKTQAHESVLHVYIIHCEPLLEAEQFDFASNGYEQQPTAQMWGGCHTCKISSSQQPYDEDSVASVFHVRKLATQDAPTRQQQSGKLTLLELTRNLFFFSQHLEGWSYLSLFFTGLEGLSQKSHLGNRGEDKERPAQGHPLPISPRFHRQVTPSNNAYKEFWRRPMSSDVFRFPGHLWSLHLSFLCYMFSNKTNNKGLVGFPWLTHFFDS